MIFQENCKVVEHKEIAPLYFKLVLSSPDISQNCRAGQFVNLNCSKNCSPLLRRPISIHRVDSSQKTFELLYQVVGKGTENLSRKKIGQEIDVLGPLGNGFDLNENIKTAILVGGGMGVAPLFYLAEELAKRNKKITTFLGNKTKETILCENDFKNLGAEVFISTDDGSYGEKGFVSDLFLAKFPISPPAACLPARQGRAGNFPFPISLFACGPRPMLKVVSNFTQAKGIKAQVCLEEMMGCGLGGCYSCVVKTKSGYARVCKEGPVFEAGEIIW